MLKFHCCIHRAPEFFVSESRSVGGIDVETIAFQGSWPPLPVTFEQAAASLESISGLHFELDGWFIWGSGAGTDRWQVDGQLSDGGSLLEFVEMKGSCPEEAFDQLLAAFGSNQSPLAIQLVQEGIFVNADGLKLLAASG